jgi:hypothetical protein
LIAFFLDVKSQLRPTPRAKAAASGKGESQRDMSGMANNPNTVNPDCAAAGTFLPGDFSCPHLLASSPFPGYEYFTIY